MLLWEALVPSEAEVLRSWLRRWENTPADFTTADNKRVMILRQELRAALRGAKPPKPKQEKAQESDVGRYRYDCDHCKFNWNCGPLCSCVLRRENVGPTPRKRMREVNRLVAAWRKERGLQ